VQAPFLVDLRAVVAHAVREVGEEVGVERSNAVWGLPWHILSRRSAPLVVEFVLDSFIANLITRVDYIHSSGQAASIAAS
jgi:hypothetical protein